MVEDFPFEEVIQIAERLVNEGNVLFQKWTCASCGARITMDRPNVFFPKGIHEDCEVDPAIETDLRQQGCNYMMIQAKTKKARDILSEFGQIP